MSSTIFLCCCTYFVYLTSTWTLALTNEQIVSVLTKTTNLNKCFDEHPISMNDIVNFEAKLIPTGKNVPCFLSCILKGTGIMNSQGYLVTGKFIDGVKKIYNGMDEFKLIKNYLENCKHVNNDKVGDGTAGCERAMKAYKCMLEKKDQLNIFREIPESLMNQTTVDMQLISSFSLTQGHTKLF